jgi:hypothetical protein
MTNNKLYTTSLSKRETDMAEREARGEGDREPRVTRRVEMSLTMSYACFPNELFSILYKSFTLKNAVFWDMAPCRYCINRCFGGTYSLHLHDRKKRKNPRARNQREQVAADLHDVISQKATFFIVTAVKTSNLSSILMYY